MKKLVKDLNGDTSMQYENIITLLQETLKIKFIMFEMFEHELHFTIGDMILYNGSPHRILAIKPEAICDV